MTRAGLPPLVAKRRIDGAALIAQLMLYLAMAMLLIPAAMTLKQVTS